ncbi:MAG: tetratricopeptide repeat protein, partial [Fusobacteriaceae bacterium]
KNEKYQKSIENYNKYLQSQEMNIKKAEARYNLAVSYDKLGNKKEAENALKKVIELFPGTSWSRKSNIYMIKLKNN